MLSAKLKEEIKLLFSNSANISDRKFIYEHLENLPEPVQRYFKYALKENQSYISSARLKHGGQFRTKENGKWMNIKGEEYFTTQNPGFVWFGKIPFVSARDKYISGKGNMLVKLLSLVTLADASGPEINQGALARWVAEAGWFPTALLPGENLRWETVSPESARIIFTNEGISVAGVFFFNETGQIIRLEMDRYKETSLEKWVCYYRKYKDFNGMRIPTDAEVTWELKNGTFNYAKFIVTNLEYDRPYLFG